MSYTSNNNLLYQYFLGNLTLAYSKKDHKSFDIFKHYFLWINLFTLLNNILQAFFRLIQFLPTTYRQPSVDNRTVVLNLDS